MKPATWASLACLGLCLGAVETATAQYYGKNPMRTNPELASQKQLSAGRIDVIYYAPIDTLARLALPIADSCISRMERLYEHRLGPGERATIYLFAEAEDYRQGWIFPGYMTPPSIGYTERFKGNVGISFDADAGRLHEVICHEIAHKFQFSLHDRSYDSHPMHRVVPMKGEYHLPPWITEGDATFASRGSSSLGDMYVRYIVNSGDVDYGLARMLSAPRSLVSYFLGAEFWRFASGDYDVEVIRELRRRERGIHARLRSGDSLRVRFFKDQSLWENPAEALEGLYGVSIRELDEAFRLYLLLRFGRDYTRTLDPEMVADRLTGENQGWYDRPYVSAPREVHRPDSVKAFTMDSVVDLYYTAANDGYESIFVQSLPYVERPPPDPDPALFDLCVRREPGDCVEYGEPPPEPAEAEDGDVPEAEGSERSLSGKEGERTRGRQEIYTRPRRISRSGTEECQALDIRSNRIDVHQGSDRRLLAYACTDSRRQTKVLVVFDMDRGREIERYPLPGLGTVRSPSWSPDGTSIAFSGIAKSGTSDLYRLDRRDGSVVKLTDDVYADGELDWSPDGGHIVFTSDRGPYGDHRRGRTHANLFLLSLDSGSIEYLTYGDWIDLAPTWSPDGRQVLFSSDREGAFDLFVVDGTGSGRRLTRVSTGILSGQWWPDGRSVVFTAFDGTQRLYRMELDPPRDGPAEIQDELIALDERFLQGGFSRIWVPTWSWEEHLAHPLVRMAEPKPVPDRYHLTLGDVGGQWSPGFGQAGVSLFYTNRDNTQLLYTQFFSGVVSGSAGTLLEITDFQNLHAEVGYLNLSRRLFWGGRCYRHSGLFADEVFRNLYGEDRIGCGAFGQYPLSVFRRLEFGLGLEWSEQADQPDLLLVAFDRLRDQPEQIEFTREAFLLRLGGAFVKDNTLWVGSFHPVDGGRYRLGCGVDVDLSRLRADTYTCEADLRKYWRTGLRSNVGTRLFLFHSGGFTPRRFTLDWRNYLTLYPAYSLYGSSGWVTNLFLGFPLVDRITFGTPAGAIRLPPVRGAFFVDAGQAWLDVNERGPVWGGLGVRGTTKIGPLWLSLSWGKRVLLNGGGLQLPEKYQGTAWALMLRGNP